jgi:flagellar biosynthesis anti-sigma factor FlgM
MRIELNTTDPQLVAAEQAKKSTTTAAGPTEASALAGDDKAAAAQDHVTLSSLATQALSQPEVRQSLVESLRQSVSNGDYKLDPTDIAGAILGH